MYMLLFMREHVRCDKMLDSSAFDCVVSSARTHLDIQQFVQRLIDESTDGYLMSGLSANNKYEYRSTAVEMRFLRLLKKMNFTGNFAVHSFRAMLANQFENAGVEENFAARIIGHKVESMTYGLYSGKIDWNNAVEAMRKIKYVRPL